MVDRVNSISTEQTVKMPSRTSAYLMGLSTFPFNFLASEIFTTLGKGFKLCDHTMISYLTKNFQNQTNAQLSQLLPITNQTNRFIAQHSFLMASNQATPFLESFLFHTLLQYNLLTALPKALRFNTNSKLSKITRVAVTAICIGLTHWYTAEGMYKGKPQDYIDRMRNFQVISNTGIGFIYATVYEYAKQSIFAPFASHALWNYFQDAMLYNDWQR